MALRCNVFCSFCGVILPVGTNGPPNAAQRPDLLWLYAVRAVYTQASDLDRSARVTPVGSMIDCNVLYIPDPPTGIRITLFQNDGSGFWGFGFHNVCWKIFHRRLGKGYGEPVVAASLFRQFYCTPSIANSGLDFGHGYRGALPIQQFGPLPCTPETNFTYADPFITLPEPLNPSEVAPWPKSLWTSPDIPTDNNSGLVKLPVELFHEVCCYLPYTQVRKLRLVNRRLANQTRHEALPKAFWKSQFLRGRDMDFFPLDTTKKRDWRTAFRCADLYLKTSHPAVINMKRVTGLSDPIAALVQRDASLGCRCVRGLNYTGSAACVTPLSAGCESARENDVLTPKLSRELYRMARPIPTQGKQTITVTTVDFGPQTFISGIFWGTDGIGFPGGLTNRSSVVVPPEASIESVEVSFALRGLVGIKWNFSDGTSSPWVGDHHDPNGAGYGIVKFPKGQRQVPLVAGFDHYKIVSICVASDEKRPAGTTVMEHHLWVPEIPPEKSLMISPLSPDLALSPPTVLVNIDFGGSGGRLLGLLTKMVVHVRTSPWPITGIEFFYNNGDTRFFGSRGDSEISFYLDGPGGERIHEVCTVNNGLEKGLTGFKVSTTFGRSIDFVMVRSLWDESCQYKLLKTQKDQLVTGFVSHNVDGHFRQLGIQSQHVDTRPIYTTCYDIYNPRVWPEKTLQKSVCDYQTYASLQGARRITVLIGSEGRPRLPAEISGLKVDYHNLQAPSIAGQMIQEGDDFEMAQNEHLQALTVWMTRHSDPDSTLGSMPRAGKVVAIRIKIRNGRIKTFGPYNAISPLPENCVEYHYEAQGHDSLIGISWVLNTDYDRLKAVRTWEIVGSPNSFVGTPKARTRPGTCGLDGNMMTVAQPS
ncbi:hypothetical protein BDV59DRAFT_187778 [Aspergillus ambiguus]|uniref:uncharacterized protein n=1 Tax=Aspergillus ambiguus TaxID=176160 RepID=UPI003CCCDEB1